MVTYFVFPPAVCQLLKDHVREHGSIKEGNSLCTFGPNGNPISVQSHPEAAVNRVRGRGVGGQGYVVCGVCG